tara:strand:+ start:530 stop:808 length:279 start_codon:yes stop_codon:yes gene_type:complete
MIKAVFETVSGRYVGGFRWDEPDHDPAIHTVVDLDDFPAHGRDLVLNAAGDGAKNATKTQKNAYDAAQAVPMTLDRLTEILISKGLITEADL